MFFQNKKTENINKKSGDGMIFYRDLHKGENKIPTDFAAQKTDAQCHLERLSQQTEKSKDPSPAFISRFLDFARNDLLKKTKNFIQKIGIFCVDHFHLLIKSAAENHLRIQACKNKYQEGEVCNLSFGSYTQLKRYQKKVRLFTYSTSSTMASVLIAILVVQIFFPGAKSQGATFTFNQTNWNGGATANNATHASNQTGWNQYESKDANIAAVNGGADLQLTPVAGSNTQTSDTDFNAGTKTNVAVSGTGAGAKVELGKNIVQVLSANGYTLILKNDGTVWGVGRNEFGQLGDNSTTGRNSLVQTTGLMGVVAITASTSYHSSFALKSDGTVWAWGYNAQGQLGDSTTTQRSAPVQVKGLGGTGFLTDVIAIAAGAYHSMALKSDGTVWAWGVNMSGMLGNNTTISTNTPIQVLSSDGISFLTGVASISAGEQTSVALKTDGTVWAWGGNNYNQVGDGTVTNRLIPVQVKGVGGVGFLTGITAISSHYYHSLALRNDGTVWAWGFNNRGQIGGTPSVVGTPSQVQGPGGVGFLTGITAVDAGFQYSMALKNDGTVWAWGDNAQGMLGDNTTTQRSAPVQVKDTAGTGFLTGITAISAGDVHSLALKNDGTVWAWGSPSYGGLGDLAGTQRNTPVQMWSNTSSGFLAGITSVSASYDHSLALKNDGTVWAWGNDASGQLGDNSYSSRSIPIQVKGVGGIGYLTGIAAIATIYRNSIALKNDGTVWTWGVGSWGQLGDNTTNSSSTPIQVKGTGGVGFLTDIAAISGTYGHYLALKNDGTVWAWGWNNVGQLGDGTIVNKSVPTQVVGLNGITAVSAGYMHSLALKSDGTVWTWGNGGNGQLGDGTLNNRLTPVQASGLTGVTALVGSASNSLALKSDGTVWAWGYNALGQLGDGTGTQRTTPVQTSGLTGVVAIVGGDNHSFAIKNDGTIWAWGYNNSGQLGNNTTSNSYIPVQVKGVDGNGFLTGVVALGGGSVHSVAVKSDGTVWAWGFNSNGQLGDGTVTQIITPVQTKAWNFPTDYLAIGSPYKTSGTFSSQVLDAGQKSSYTTLTYNQTLVANTNITVDLRSGNTATPDGSWTAWQTGLASGASIAAQNGNQYFQYRLNFSSDGSGTSQFNDATISFLSYTAASLSLTSSPYNSNSFANLLADIKWTEDVPAGTNVKFQMRTASDNAGAPDWTTGSGWCGPDPDGAGAETGCAATKADTDYATSFYQTSPTGETANPVHITDNNDQWMQYIVWLESTDTSKTPTLSDITLTYVANITPQIQNIVSSQDSDGKVTTTFEVRDGDTTTGATNGTVLGGLQYCAANCQTPGSETWANATTLSYKNALENVLPNNTLSIEEVNYTTYSIVWDPKIDYNAQYDANIKVRVSVNDSEVANNIGYGISNAFILDTKNPTNAGVIIDHSKTSNNLTLTTPSDDSTYQVAYSNYSDFRDATFENFPSDNKKTYNNLTIDPATVYVRIKDAKGNYTDASSTTPAKPSNVVYYDTSNSTSNEYREFVAWDVVAANRVGAGFASYDIYRADRLESDPTAALNYALLTSITSRTTNFYTDLALDNSKHYYYKVLIKDTIGNISQYSSVVEDNPNGQGGSDQTPPTISNVAVTNINTTSAKVTWTTDELSDSSVGYSENITYLPERGLASMTLSHEIVLTGLNPGTSYNIRVKSHDLVGNLGQNDKDSPGSTLIQNFTFSTLPGPAISDINVKTYNNEATIKWKTTTNSNSFIVYSDTVSNGLLLDPKEFGNPDLVGGSAPFNHAVTINSYKDAPLIEGTPYYFYIKSVDSTGNVAILKNGADFFELITDTDNDSPVISNITTPLVTKDGAIISWITDEPATSKVSYGTKNGGPYDKTQQVMTYDRSHYIILSSLTPDTKYYYKVESSDINANASTPSAQHDFTTVKDTEFLHDPLSTIENISAINANLADKTALITFTTDQPALCYVSLDTASNISATSTTVFENGYVKDINYNTSHAIPLADPPLKPLTTYFYSIDCHDNIITAGNEDEVEKYNKFENWADSEILDFKTLEEMYTADGAGALGDKLAPVINNVKVDSVTGESATIVWDTNEEGNSIVGYGISATNESGANDQVVNDNKDKYATTHTVVISGLIPATKYLFKSTSIDISGNIGQSAEFSFTTASPSSLTSIKAQSKNLGQATITWNTSNETTSTVEYGLTSSYGEKKESSTQTKEHSLELTSLNQGTVYHYRVKGKDKNGKLYASSDQTFEPKSPPKIENISVNDITEHEAKVSFETNVPTSATVTFANLSDPQDNGSQSNMEMATKHSIQLRNLSQGSTFNIKISARDEQATESIQDANDLTTGQDEQPPKIDNIKTDSALTQNDKVQAIISWKTDEQATTSILYKEGRNGEEREIKITDNLTTGHVAVITIFKPGTVYNFRVKSIDASGNQAISNDFALLTPKRRENIIQIIVGNFADIFGWAKF